MIAEGRAHRSLDDYNVLERALKQPDLLVQEPDTLTIDEVQRAPGMLLAIKREVDRSRKPGRAAGSMRRTCVPYSGGRFPARRPDTGRRGPSQAGTPCLPLRRSPPSNPSGMTATFAPISSAICRDIYETFRLTKTIVALPLSSLWT
jgi:hypothetical protein